MAHPEETPSSEPGSVSSSALSHDSHGSGDESGSLEQQTGVKISPMTLYFPLPHTVPRMSNITVKNGDAATSKRYLTFKMKTTAPKRYCVRPNQGIVAPGEVVVIQVILNGTRDETKESHHKFQLLTVLLPPGDDGGVAAVREANAGTPDVQATQIAAKKLWSEQNVPRSLVVKSKLSVRFSAAPASDVVFKSAHDEAPVFEPTIKTDLSALRTSQINVTPLVAGASEESEDEGSEAAASAVDSAASLASALPSGSSPSNSFKAGLTSDQQLDRLQSQLTQTGKQRDELQRRVSKLSQQVSVLQLREQNELRRRTASTAAGSTVEVASPSKLSPAAASAEKRKLYLQFLVIAILFFFLGRFLS